MKKTHVALAILLGSITICVSGCLLVAVGAGAAGTVAYVKGDLTATLDAGMDRSYGTVLRALDQLKITATQKQQDTLTSEIIARNSVDEKVTIKLTRTDEKLTNISIRIGIFGDQAQSRIILERIKQNLM
jgi:hypothetical protein